MEQRPDTPAPPITTEFSSSPSGKIWNTKTHIWPVLFCCLVLCLLYCFGHLEKTAEGLSADSFVLEDLYLTPVLNISPVAPPFRGEVLLLPNPGQSKESYSFLAEELADEGFNVFCLDLPGMGDSSNLFAFSGMSTFLESAYTSLFIRNLIVPQDTAVIAFGRSGGVISKFLSDHPQTRTAAIVNAPFSPPTKNPLPSAHLQIHRSDGLSLSLFPCIPNPAGIKEQLREAFPLEGKSIPIKQSPHRLWWKITLFFTIFSFPFMLKTMLLFLPLSSEEIVWDSFSRKSYLTGWGWILLMLGLAGLYHFQLLQPVGFMSIGTLLCLTIYLTPLAKNIHGRWNAPRFSTFFLPMACFFYLYWLVGITAVQGGVHLRINTDRWAAMLLTFFLFLPFTAYLEWGMNRLRSFRPFSHCLLFYLGLYLSAVITWYLGGFSPFVQDSPLTLSFLGFSGWEPLLAAIMILVLFTALFREWSRNCMAALLFHTLFLSWLFTSLSMRIA
jgi:pimeloyl-ACP methyl ester carboxylesterase